MTLNLSSYKGTHDIYPDDMAVRNYIFGVWRDAMQRFAYKEYQTPLLEPIELYRAKSSEEIVNEQTYSFVDRGGRELTIRPEMTPSVVRMVANKRQDIAIPARLFSIANFMRYERPQKGRDREFIQLNFDLFGVETPEADYEIINLAHYIMASFGATDDMFSIRINDREFVNRVLSDYIGVDGDKAVELIRLIDRYDKLESGVFRNELEKIIAPAKADKLLALLETSDIDDLPKELNEYKEANKLQKLLIRAKGAGINNVIFSFKLMRGFDYYTGLVFEVFDTDTENRRTLFGGGRYDKLMGLFGVEPMPIVGAAFGEVMVREFLLTHDLLPKADDLVDTMAIILPIGDREDVYQYSDKIAGQLRKKGKSIAIDFTARKVGSKIKSAVNQDATWAIFIGDDDIDTAQLNIKNLKTGEQSIVDVDKLANIL